MLYPLISFPGLCTVLLGFDSEIFSVTGWGSFRGLDKDQLFCDFVSRLYLISQGLLLGCSSYDASAASVIWHVKA